MKLYFTTLALLIVGSLFAQDCAPGWTFYRVITIDNSAGAELTDYQVQVTLDTRALADAGTLRADGADLRVFTTDCTPLSFWGDSLGVSSTTRLYVKIPSLAAGASVDLQLYYGRPQAEAATDGENTFIFFDDFSSGAIDPTKWETVGEFAQFEVIDGRAVYGSTSMNPGPRFKYARTAASFSDPVTFEFAGIVSNANGFGLSSATDPLNRILFRQSGFGFDTINQVAVIQDTLSNGAARINNFPLLRIPRGELTTQAITAGVNANNFLEVTRFANVGLGDENVDTTVLTEDFDVAGGFHFIMSSFAPNFAITLDYLHVRQVVDTPPTSSVGGALMATPSSVSFALTSEQVRVFPNPVSAYLQVIVEVPDQIYLSLHDVTGRQITEGRREESSGTRWTLDLTDVARGSYFLRVARTRNGELLYTHKVLVE
ncbi:MAG: DUF2341 domain-containing protein [Bacteroidota bacterium]